MSYFLQTLDQISDQLLWLDPVARVTYIFISRPRFANVYMNSLRDFISKFQAQREIYKNCSEFYNIFPPEIRVNFGAYQEARNVSFSENFAYVLNGGTLKLLYEQHFTSASYTHPETICLFKINNKNTRKRFEIWSKLKTQVFQCFQGVQKKDIVLVFLLSTFIVSISHTFFQCF